MKKTKRKFFMSLLLACVMFFTISLSGCMGIISKVIIDLFNIEGEYPEYESGDWRYAVRKNKDGTKEGYIVDFSLKGKEKEYVILPTQLDGITIVGIGYSIHPNVMVTRVVCNLQSTNIQRIYMPNTSTYTKPVDIYCDKLPKDCLQIVWSDIGNADWGVSLKWGDDYFFGVNQYISDTSENAKYTNRGHIANVTYMYNYDNAPNGGYYWADNYENDLIKYIPPEPKREGYTFVGWYKDRECTEKWNFENDKTGDNIIVDSPFNLGFKYTGTYLYAKWRENT